ncbi:hypothetical protein CEXT_123171 [Caerostris extrusa]|uniref:Uncharacterized protein n=1 Tax=Caerostris extrusa TaxID=172846 RepID=A0AAV4XWU1_CAEEX|nr:hypothetical protein CEXT_123171 [Caerostris extrusa]
MNSPARLKRTKRDCDSSHITWKSDLDIMSLKGKSAEVSISLSEVHHDTSARFHPSEPPLHTAGGPPTSFGKSKTIICDASPLKDQGTMPSKEVSKSH